GQWFRYFTGIVQIAGAVLVLVPRTFVVGIALLACTMAGAVAIWIVRFGAVGNAIIPAVVLVGLVGVGVHGAGVSRRAAPGTDRRAGGLWPMMDACSVDVTFSRCWHRRRRIRS